MKLFSIAPTLLLITFTTTTMTTNAAEEVWYDYKENSNNAFTSSFWQVEPCVDVNSFSMFISDGFVEQTGSRKTAVKSMSGSAVFYSKCKTTGATRTDINFYSTEPATGLTFTALTNATVKTNMTAFYSKTQCVIESYDNPGETGPYSYYVCGDVFESGNKALSIDMVMVLPPVSHNFTEYETTSKGFDRGPGFIIRYESKAICKSTIVTKTNIKLGKKVPFVIPNSEWTNEGEICKVENGHSERVIF